MNILMHLNIILTLSFIALLSACGASTTPLQTGDLSSTGLTDSSGKPLAKCNKAGTSTLSYKIAAQVSGDSYDPNWTNVYLSNLPTGFEASTTYIQFFKAQAANDTQLSYSGTALSFGIYDKEASAYLNNSATYTSLKWSDVQNLISGATPASFMSRVIFVLHVDDPTAAYQVLSAASYTTSNNAIIEYVPSLLPTFHANPTDYAIKANGTARETVLKNLHPLKNQSGDFAALADALCH